MPSKQHSWLKWTATDEEMGEETPFLKGGGEWVHLWCPQTE